MDMAEPSKTPLAQHGVEAEHLSLFEDFFIRHLILPFDAEDASEVSHVKAIEAFFLS